METVNRVAAAAVVVAVLEPTGTVDFEGQSFGVRLDNGGPKVALK